MLHLYLYGFNCVPSLNYLVYNMNVTREPNHCTSYTVLRDVQCQNLKKFTNSPCIFDFFCLDCWKAGPATSWRNGTCIVLCAGIHAPTCMSVWGNNDITNQHTSHSDLSAFIIFTGNQLDRKIISMNRHLSLLFTW